MARERRSTQAGAALVTALLSVALIASLAGTALWQQWRVTEVERSERARLQGQWLLSGATDWGRLILREDARSSGVDHLGEPWALPLKDARLSSFLAADKTVASDAFLSGVFLAGRIDDLQGRLNISNLVDGKQVSAPDLAMFRRLFALLGLPEQELQALALALRDARHPQEAAPGTPRRLLPRRVEHLGWLGLSPPTLARLAPYVTLLPERTGVNLNTAPAEVLSAAAPELPLAQAQRLVAERQQRHWQSIDDANLAAGNRPQFQAGTHVVGSRYFQIAGQLRQGDHLLNARALVRRDGLSTSVLWRDLQVLPAEAAKAQR